MTKKVQKLLTNKYVFYAAVIFAVLNVLGYVSMRFGECVVMFAAVAYATRCYAKNDTVAILAGIFVSNPFGCNRVKEGFTEAIDGATGAVDKANEKNLMKKKRSAKKKGKHGTMQIINVKDSQPEKDSVKHTKLTQLKSRQLKLNLVKLRTSLKI